MAKTYQGTCLMEDERNSEGLEFVRKGTVYSHEVISKARKKIYSSQICKGDRKSR